MKQLAEAKNMERTHSHQPTDTGLNILENLKQKYFPNGYQCKKSGCKDYRFSRKGQAEFKRGHQLVMMRLSNVQNVGV
ncbi:hypothetical protein ACOIV3_001871 [Vibrio vulnificus]